MNYQRKKNRWNNLKKAQKKTTILEGKLRKRDEELTTAAEELKKKKGDIIGLQQVTHDSIYQPFFYRGWNRADDFYICDTNED